jgi:hypothetical protein
MHSALAWSRRVRNVSRSATRSSFCWISFSSIELLGSRRESCAIACALFEIDEPLSVARTGPIDPNRGHRVSLN